MEKEIERSSFELSESEKRKYLFLKQINTLNAFRERNAISKEQYDISYYGLVSKMKITDKELLEITRNKKRIIILNKMDLNNKANIDLPHIMISALKGEGLREIEAEIIKIAKINELNKVDATYLTNARQVSKLQLAYNAILDAIASSSIYLPVDMVELDIKKAWDTLGEIIGISSGDELINELFSKFCLGK